MKIVMTVATATLLAVGLAQWCSAQSGEGDSAKGGDKQNADKSAKTLRDAYEAQFKPLFLESQQAWWDANTTGSDEAVQRRKQAENALVDLHSDPGVFAQLKALKDQGGPADPVLRREMEIMYRAYLKGQADKAVQKRIVELEAEVEQIFNTHRSDVQGKALSENDVRSILSQTKDSKEAETAWKGYMEVGAKVEGKLEELVALRNQMAKQLGFANYFAMSLDLQEIGESELIRLFDELDELTREPFAKLKQRIDSARAARFGIDATALRPWHYGDLFFQEVPDVQGADLDSVYNSKDLLALAQAYYKSLGMPVDDIIGRSDLYEKPGKSPHAFCTCMDRANDIRMLCNMKNNAYWADTLLHELGHGVYDKYVDSSVPFLLHEASHSITTEGVAMMFGAMSKNAEFLTRVAGVDPGQAAALVEAATAALRAEKAVFSRWAQVMVRFEQGMYGRPDQDLGKLWWDLKKRYQLLNPPDDVSRPDYGAKVHIVTAPVYYHSYLMGDLFGCQVHHYLARHVLGIEDITKTCFYGREKAGEFLKQKVFGPGNLYSWNELTRRATGEPLTAKYFVEMFMQEPAAKQRPSPEKPGNDGKTTQ